MWIEVCGFLGVRSALWFQTPGKLFFCCSKQPQLQVVSHITTVKLDFQPWGLQTDKSQSGNHLHGAWQQGGDLEEKKLSGVYLMKDNVASRI